jgi:maltose O-acetyltransferase
MATEKAKMLQGEHYDPSDPTLRAARLAARETTRAFNDTGPGDEQGRTELLADLFGSGGATAHVEPPFRCDYGAQIHVGEAFYANFECVFLDVCRIEFGDRCLLGPGVHVYTATHPLDPDARAEGLERGEPVTVGEDVWIGGRAVLNPGVTVGSRSVVASGAVVTDDVPEDVLVQGNPATVVTRRE